MANENNLIPYTKGSRSKEEAQKAGAKGGIASGAARRRKRTMKQMANFVLALKPNLPPKVIATIVNMGVDTESEDVNMLMMTILAVAQKAIKGDLKAAQLLLEISGEAVTSYDQTDKERFKLERERLKLEREKLCTMGSNPDTIPEYQRQIQGIADLINNPNNNRELPD